MNVDNGVRIVDQGDLAGALPWFAEALRLDSDDPAAAATHRLRLGTLLKQTPVLEGVFAHDKTILWATFDRRAGGSPPPRPTTRPGSGTWRPGGGLAPVVARRPGQLGRVSERRNPSVERL